MIKMTGHDGTTREVSAEEAAKLLEGCKPLSMLDATLRPTEHMRRAAVARGFPRADWRTFDEWLAFKPELFPAEWRDSERWQAVIRDRWVMGAAEGNPRQAMDEETFVKRLADAMRLPAQGPY